MKFKKNIIILILLLTLCTGCSIEYNITITKNDIIETINVTDTITSTRTDNIIMNNYNNWYPTYSDFEVDFDTPEEVSFNQKYDGVEYHEKSINQSGNTYNYTYKYTYPIEKYGSSNILNSTFENVTIFEGDDSLTIRTSKESLLCGEEIFDSATINITIDTNDYILNSTNATSTNNNTFTWTIDKNNCDNTQIILTLDEKKNTTVLPPEEPNENDTPDISKSKSNISNYAIYIFLGVIIIIILIGYRWFNKMKEKNNQMDD